MSRQAGMESLRNGSQNSAHTHHFSEINLGTRSSILKLCRCSAGRHDKSGCRVPYGNHFGDVTRTPRQTKMHLRIVLIVSGRNDDRFKEASQLENQKTKQKTIK